MNDYTVESDGQLFFKYIGGLRQQFQDALNFFDPLHVSEAHQRALHFEKTFSRRPLGLVGGGNRGSNRPIPTPLHMVRCHDLHKLEGS